MDFGPQHQRPALVRPVDEVGQVLQRRVAEPLWVDVAEDDHVVAEQFVAPDGKAAQRGGILPGVFRIGVLQDRVQPDRAVPREHVAQVTELEIGIRLDQQHADLLVGHADRPLQAVVVGLQFAVERFHLDHVSELADLARPIRKPDLSRPPVRKNLDCGFG
jgi:hypothetical protein